MLAAARDRDPDLVSHELRTPIATEGHLEGLLSGMVEPTPALWALLRATIAGQSAEIAQMQGWHQAWYGVPPPPGGHGMGATPMGGGPMHGPGNDMPRHGH